NKYYSTLKRLFDEHFRIEENGKVALKPKEDISSGTLQSAFDTDCSYRDKDGLKVKGYSVNVTETCDDGSLNLITDIQVAKANKPDFQLSYHTRNNKTRYRGLIQHKMWALLRCIWINLRRIMGYVEQICQRTGLSGQNRPPKSVSYQKIDLKNRFVRIFNLCQTFLRILNYFKPKLVFKQLYFL
ncbi:MAG: hypothetical protein K0B05_10975, partial [Bacteroidales bacterium]|nr:hypothetical protein [Bacteroidales bacterium]